MAGLTTQLQTPNGHKYSQPTGLFINNEFVASSTGKKVTSIDPATEKEIASVYAASAQDVDKAVNAARAALVHPSWKLLSGSDRGRLMIKLAELIESNKELLASIDAWDNGKPYSVAVEEDVPETANVLRYYAGWTDKLTGQLINDIPGKFAYVIRQPIGVVGQIIPWNYPLAMASWKLGPALACGNTIVLKPAEQTPLSILVLGSLIKEAGFPPGVVNIVNGLGSEAGSALVRHPQVDKIAFTGSTATARNIMKMAAETLKDITLETGGKSPLLVFNDADLTEAVTWAHIGIMSNQGQICTSTSRILVQEDIHDAFVDAFIKHIKKTSVVGNPFDQNTFQGPQVTKTQYDKILSYIDKGKSEGATVSTGGAASSGKGYYIEPTVFTGVKETATIFQEEIFGPVVAISKFRDEDDGIRMANNTPYGLGAAVFTQDLEKAHRVSAEIQAGMVWINSSQDSDYRIPFGGVKQSGIGRELGEAGLKAYSQLKAVHVNMSKRQCKL